MTSLESSGLNAGYVEQLLEQYLDNPEAVDPAWRGEHAVVEPAAAAAVPAEATRPVALTAEEAPTTELPAPASPAPQAAAPTGAVVVETRPDTELVAGVAAAMSLVKAYRMHGHLNAHLDPLGSEPMGDPALDETRLEPPLTPELQARIPARLLRLSVPGETLLDALPRLREVYTGTIAY